MNRAVRKRFPRWSCLVLCMLMMLPLWPVSACATGIIRVGSFDGTYNTVNEKGERSGYGYEYMRNIAGYTGWTYQYVDSSWADCFAQLERGEIDLVGGISYTEERGKTMLFSDLPMGEEKYYIYTDIHHDRLSAADLDSFNGESIGVLKGHIPEELLKAWEEKHGLKLRHVNIASVDDTLEKLESHEISCFVSTEDSYWERKQISPLTNIGKSDIYFAVNRNRPDIKQTLDNAMRRILDDNPFYTDDLYRRYLSAQSSAILSDEEREWLAQHGQIRIGYLHNDPGVSVWDSETGELTGIITDYVDLAKDCLQGQILEFQLKGYSTRDQQLQALHNGEIDLVFHVSQNPYSAETNGFVLSDTVWTFNMAAVTAQTGFDETAESTVAVSKDNVALKAYISYNYPQWTVLECETTDGALQAVRNGAADCLLRNSGTVYEYLKNRKLHCFFLTKPADASFAVRQGEPVLLSILNKTLMSVPTAKFTGAVVSYSNAARKVTAADFAADNIGVVSSLLVLVIVVVCAFWFDSIRSGKKAEKLNGELGNALEEANRQSEIVGAISRIYSFIYRFNLLEHTFEEICADPDLHGRLGTRGRQEPMIQEAIQTVVSEEYRPILESFMDLSTLSERLWEQDNLAIEYRTVENTWKLARFIVKKRDEAGNVTDVLFVGMPIDKQKQLENQYKQKLLFSSRVLSGLSTDYTIALVLNLDTDEYQVAFSQGSKNARHMEPTKTFREYVERFTERYILPEHRDMMLQTFCSQSIQKRFVGQADYYVSFETLPNAAGLSCFQAHIVREYDEGGHLAFLGFRSVDDAIRQERHYKQLLQNQLDLITAALPGGVKISRDDAEYSFKYVSEQFAAMLGYESSAALMESSGGSFVGLVHPDDLKTGVADALRQYSASDHYDATYRMRCKDGSYKYIEDRGQKVISPEGVVEHWNLMLDKNDLMEKTIALESEKKANQSKTNFLTRMSHDMRTPLNGIIGLMKINLDHFGDTALALENYRKMQISADHLLSLINDVLQMSKIEDGTVPLTHEVVDFAALSRNIADLVEARAADSGIKLEFREMKEGIRFPYVYGSPLHLRQIFLNIYGNCVKYNRPGGSILTSTDYWLDEQGRCVYEWVISDTGIGMSKGFLEHIFEPFVQEKEDARSVYQGTGLGMAIVKGLVDQMGGTVTVDSQEGVGSTFTVRIPFEIAQAPVALPVEQEEMADVRGLKILLAEDNELNAEIAGTLLGDAGAKITRVPDGRQAVEAFSHGAPGTFDAILMDIMMPVMDGYEATEAIRGLTRPDAKTVPIIAMTANAFTEDAQKCFAAGMNAHLSKPMEIQKVLATIAACCAANQHN